VAWASTAAGTVRGRRGYSGELGETVLCAKQREIGWGFLLTAHRGRRRAHGRRGGGSEGAGELGARLPRASWTKTCDNTSLSSSWRSQNQRERAGGPILHRRRRIDGGGGNPRRRRGEIDARARVLACCRGKGRRRGSCTSLNRGAGRQVKRGEDGVAGRLPLMAAAITARV
jgi:hypothetical protein